MQEAGALIELIQAPVGSLVEEIDGVQLVHADVSVKGELLILLHHYYPETVPVKSILDSLSRRCPETVRKRLRELHNNKLAHGNGKDGYRLTQAGHALAVSEIHKLQT